MRFSWVVLLMLMLATAGCAKKRAPTTLVPSSWNGVMTYQGQTYQFHLTIKQVEPDGRFDGELGWPVQGVVSPIEGVADGDHLVFTDQDNDKKDVRLDGTTMSGTDKNGQATWDARQVASE